MRPERRGPHRPRLLRRREERRHPAVGLIGALAVGAVSWLVSGCGGAPEAASSTMVVVSVADGDTVSVQLPDGTRQRVRLLGIDAPEVAHDGRPAACGGPQARDALHDLVFRRQVTVIDDPRADREDRFGRRLAYLDLDGQDVNRLMVERGYVAVWAPSNAPRPSRAAEYAAVQATARAERRGSWATCRHLGR